MAIAKKFKAGGIALADEAIKKTDWINGEGLNSSSNIQSLLQRQVEHEFDNERLYMAMAIWCDRHDYQETAKFFSKHTLEERKHALDFLNFMLSQKMNTKAPKLGEIQTEFEDMQSLLEAALEREKKTSKMIGEIHTAALKGGNLALTIAGKYLNEQVEEEQLFTAILKLYETAAGNKADFEMMVMDIKKHDKFKPGKLYAKF